MTPENALINERNQGTIAVAYASLPAILCANFPYFISICVWIAETKKYQDERERKLKEARDTKK